jgi:antitoxin component YwqK of YwqJK toxin-antitoxin module
MESPFRIVRINQLLLFVFLLLPIMASAEIKYDSLSWYSKEKLEFARWADKGTVCEYHFYPNGHVQDIARWYSGRLLTRYEFYSNGERKFDTVCSENYYNWSWTYYPNGARKRFVQEQFPSSYSSSHTRFEIIEWDEAGEVSRLYQKDEQNNVVVDQAYPFRKYHKLKLHQVFDLQGQLIEHGFYTENPVDGNRMKQGCSATFYPNGKLKTIGLFMDDLPCGIHYVYSANGVLLAAKNYVAGKETEFAADNLASNESGIQNPNYPSWYWKKLTSEGLVLQPMPRDSILNYYYRGMVVVSVSALSKSKPNQLNLEFGFLAIPYWSSYTQYRVEYNKSKIAREYEMMNGSWVSNRIYNENGIAVWAYNCSSRQTTTRNANGLLLTRESPYRSDEIRTASGFWVYGGMNDSSITFDAKGGIATTVVYGLYGQKYCTHIYSNGKIISSDLANEYARLFVTVVRGKTIEVLDDDVLLPGYYERRNAKNKILCKGRTETLRDGLWIEFDPKTGRKSLVQYYDNGTPKAKGRYEEYYSNGNPKTKGAYDDHQQQVGVWKTYDSKGRMNTRCKYKNGSIKGIEFCRTCCFNRHGRYLSQMTIHLEKKQFRLRKCRTPVDPTYID